MHKVSAFWLDVSCFLKEDAAGSRMELALVLAIVAGLGGLALLALRKLDITNA